MPRAEWLKLSSINQLSLVLASTQVPNSMWMRPKGTFIETRWVFTYRDPWPSLMTFRLPSWLLRLPTPFSGKNDCYNAQIKPNIVANIMVGNIYITMKEIERNMWRVTGNPRVLVTHMSQRCEWLVLELAYFLATILGSHLSIFWWSTFEFIERFLEIGKEQLACWKENPRAGSHWQHCWETMKTWIVGLHTIVPWLHPITYWCCILRWNPLSCGICENPSSLATFLISFVICKKTY